MKSMLNKSAKLVAMTIILLQSAMGFAHPRTIEAQLQSFSVDEDSTTSAIGSQAIADEGEIHYIVEEMPVFPGGDLEMRKYIADNVVFPDEAKKQKMQGKVMVQFVVNEEGLVENPQIAVGVDPVLDKEAIRVVQNMPKWTPGKHQGKLVKVAFTVPVNFMCD